MLDGKSIVWSMNKQLGGEGGSRGGWMCIRSSAYCLAIRLTAGSLWQSEGLEKI